MFGGTLHACIVVLWALPLQPAGPTLKADAQLRLAADSTTRVLGDRHLATPELALLAHHDMQVRLGMRPPNDGENMLERFFSGRQPGEHVTIPPEFEAELRRADSPWKVTTFRENYERHIRKTAADSVNINIWNGIDACAIDAYRECVMVRTVRADGAEEIGSAVLLSPRWALTAAHCVRNPQAVYIYPDCEGIAGRRPIPCAVTSWDGTLPPDVATPDIALLKLSADLAIPAPDLAPAWVVDQAPSVLAVGYGFSDLNNTAGLGKRRFTKGMIVLSKNCTPDDGSASPTTEFCCHNGIEMVADVTDTSGKAFYDTCSGDSGGPAYVTGPDGALLLAALTRGPRRPSQDTVTCATMDPSRCGFGACYTRVDSPAVREWVFRHTRLPAWN